MDFKSKLGQKFIFSTELGGINGTLLEDSIEKAKTYEGLDAINIHDCPNARLRMNSIMAGAVLQRVLGVTAIPHFTCRDRSLLGTQADLLGAHALGIRCLLPTTGDGPQHGPYKSSGVYDYNSVGLMKLIKELNAGRDAIGEEIKGNTEFLVSATATPGAKNLDAEIRNMEKKIGAGADFFQTQAVYDVEQTKAFLAKARGLGMPILLGIMPLKSLKMAQFVSENVAGVTVPDGIFEQLEAGKTGYEIACDFIREIYQDVDGIHIFGMGDIATTNKLVAFTKGLLEKEN